MQNVILITPSDVDSWRIAECFSSQERIDVQSLGRIVVHGVFGILIFDLDEFMMYDFEKDELEKIRALSPASIFWRFVFSSPDAANFGIRMLIQIPGCLIDNDCGILTSVEEICRRIERNSPWIWEKE